ncbi:MAG: hypothetical protein SNH88_03370 [Rikenellaceae bacterium]
MMNIKKLPALMLGAICLASLGGCNEKQSLDYDEIELQVLDLWMEVNHPEYLGYRQEDGYYVIIEDEGDMSAEPIGESEGWVRYNYTATNLWGNVGVTRNELIAYQQGTFNYKTHYVPYYAYSSSDEDSTLITEWTRKAMRDVLTIDGTEYQMRKGTIATIYMPSSLVGNSTAFSGGYQGQYSLDESMPMIAKIEITDVVSDPDADETTYYDSFISQNSAYWSAIEVDDEPAEISLYTGTLPRVYNISDSYSTSYVETYSSQVPSSPYNQSMKDLDIEVGKALYERFGTDDIVGDSVGIDNDATIWYIVRTLDGFYVDSNIDEIRELVFGEIDSDQSAIVYNAEDDEDDYIPCWYYAIPLMRYGNWNSVVASSDYCYDYWGVVGKSSTSQSDLSGDYDYYDYYDYYSSYTDYYTAYNSYYNNRERVRVAQLAPLATSSATTRATTSVYVTTEILPYTPLIFDIYISSNDSDEDDDEEED